MKLDSKISAHAPWVAGVGTCRLRELMEHGFERRSVIAVPGFCHNLADAYQRLKMMTGEVQIPPAFKSIIHGHGKDSSLVRGVDRKFEKIRDVCTQEGPYRQNLIIEWSNLKCFKVEDFYINPSYLGRMIIRPGGLRWLDWWSGIMRGKIMDVEEVLRLIDETENIDLDLFSKDDLRRIVQGLKFHVMGPSECMDLVSKIRNIIPSSRMHILITNATNANVIEIIESNPDFFDDVNIIRIDKIVKEEEEGEIYEVADGRVNYFHFNTDNIGELSRTLYEQTDIQAAH